MKAGKWSSSSTSYRLLVGLIVVSLICLFGFTPAPRGVTRLSLSFPDYSGVVETELFGFRFGLSRSPDDEFGIGLGLGDKRSVSFGNWEVAPFIAGGFSSRGLNPDGLTGGLEASYFDYQIGGWALTSTSRAWVRRSGFSLGSNGSYSVGNLSLDYDLKLEFGFRESTWFPDRAGNYWTRLNTGQPTETRSTSENQLTIYGGKRIPLEKESIQWHQGLVLGAGNNSPGLVTRFSYKNNFLLAKIKGLKLDGWSLQLVGEKLGIGFTDYSGNGNKYGLSVSYGGDREVSVEVIEYLYDPVMTVNFTVEW